MTTIEQLYICKNCKYFFHTQNDSGACNALPKGEWTEEKRNACSLFEFRTYENTDL